MREDAGFTLADGAAFTRAGIGLGVVAPLSDAISLAGLELLPAFLLQLSFDLTTEFDENAWNRLGVESGFALRTDVTP